MNFACARKVSFTPIFNEFYREYILHHLHSEFIAQLCMSTRNHILTNDKTWIDLNQSRGTSSKPFVGMLQICTVNTATNINSQCFVGYAIHITCFNNYVKIRSFLIDLGNKLVDFLYVGLQESLSEKFKEQYCGNIDTCWDDIILIDDRVGLTL